MGNIPKGEWIRLYKDLRRSALQFPQYSYREFFKRRIRDHFAAAVKNENIQQTEFYEKCQDLLKVIRRQSALHRFYPTSKLVIEEEKEGKETNQNS